MSGKNNTYRGLTIITALFVTTLVVSNIIAVKLIHFLGFNLPAAVILFPITYILGDVLTEVYGFRIARRVIWTGFGCNLIAVIAIFLAGRLPAAPFWSTAQYQTTAEAQRAYQAILGFTPRLILASFLAYLSGEFINSYILAKLKIYTSGKYLWIRTLGSTVFGQGIDTGIFITVAFAGILPASALGTMIISQWIFKVSYETTATPLTYLVVHYLKKSEGVDPFDTETNFTPLKWGETNR